MCLFSLTCVQHPVRSVHQYFLIDNHIYIFYQSNKQKGCSCVAVFIFRNKLASWHQFNNVIIVNCEYPNFKICKVFGWQMNNVCRKEKKIMVTIPEIISPTFSSLSYPLCLSILQSAQYTHHSMSSIPIIAFNVFIIYLDFHSPV